MGLAGREALKQPTWCRLQPDGWATLAARVSAGIPENLLFIAKPAPPAGDKGGKSGKGNAPKDAAASGVTRNTARTGSAPGTEAIARAGGPDVAVGSSPSLSGGRLPE